MKNAHDCFALCILIIAGFTGLTAQVTLAGDGVLPKPLAAMLDCQPLDSAVIDAGLPRPVVDVPEGFTNDRDAVGIYMQLSWQPMADPAFPFFYVQASLSPEFETIYACDFVSGGDSAIHMYSAEEDTLWFRVRVVDSVGGYRFGPPSDPPVAVIFDITPPELMSLAVTATPIVGDRRPRVGVYFEGRELYPDSLLLSGAVTFDRYQAFAIEADTGTVVCSLSYDEERKFIYGKMIDKAGNAGNIMGIDTIVGSHSHNYPNPFSPNYPGENMGSTNLVFYLTADQADQEIMVYIYDLFGNLVDKWRVTSPRAGINDGGESTNSTLKWDGRNQDEKLVADGGYICVIKAGDEILSRHKIAVAK